MSVPYFDAASTTLIVATHDALSGPQEGCCEACKGEPRCFVFGYKRASQKCYLKDAGNKGAVPMDGVVSGVYHRCAFEEDTDYRGGDIRSLRTDDKVGELRALHLHVCTITSMQQAPH
jgi:hypothetical protein